jgi:hypothetical protein
MKEKKLEKLANVPGVPGIGPDRNLSKLQEEILAFKSAHEVKPKVIEVKDINAAAFVKTKVCSPTVSMKGNGIYFVFPENERTKLCLEVYKLNPSKTLASSVAALRMLEAQVAAMRK